MRSQKISPGILLSIVIVAIGVSVLIGAYRYLFLHDFHVYSQVECDPEVEECFTAVCEEGDTECEVYSYKLVFKRATDIPPVNLCAADDTECEVVYCTEKTLALYELPAECS